MRRLGRILVPALGLIALVLATLTLITFFKLRAARASFEDARTHARGALEAASRYDLETARRSLVLASDDFVHAEASLTGIEFNLLRLLPPAGRALATTRTVARAGAIGSDGVLQAIDSARLFPTKDGRPTLTVGDGTIDPAPIQAANPRLVQARRQIDDARLLLARAPVASLGEVQRARIELATRLDRASADVGRAADLTDLLGGMLGGPEPHRYLLALENPAEMRGLGGMVLAYGELTVARGRVTLDQVGSVTEVSLTTPARIDLPPDFIARFSWQSPTQAWQNTTPGLDFPTSGRLLAAIYEQASGRSVDGVILADSVFLAQLAELVGPIEVGSLTIAPQGMRAFLLRDQYVLPEQQARHELLGEVARKVIGPLFSSRVDSEKLATATAGAVAERRLALWIRDGTQQALVARLGADARFPDAGGDFMATTVQNHSGDKADVFIRPAVSYEATVSPTGATVVDQTLEVHNTLTAEQVDREPSTVIGPYEEQRRGQPPPLPAGWYRAWVNLYSSPGSYLLGTSLTDSANPHLEVEASHTVLSGFLTVRPGETAVVTARFGASSAYDPETGAFQLTVLPQPRSDPTHVRVVVRFPPGHLVATSPGAVADGTTLRFEGDLSRLAEIKANWTPVDALRQQGG